MKTLKMKVVAYEDSTDSLIVSFASTDNISQNPEDYQAMAYQPANMWPDITDLDEIKKRIAMSGVHVADQQASRELLTLNPSRKLELKSLVGQTFTYDINDLNPYNPDPVEEI